MIVGVPRESYPGERRVALVPMVVPNLTKADFEVIIETGAGLQAGYPDKVYAEKGAKIISERAQVFASADFILQVLCYGSNDVTGKADLALMRRGQTVIGFLRPLGSAEVLQEIAATGVTSCSVELVPRTTRAQSMDALSSMGTICGYKAVLIAADRLPRIFPMLTTAAGTITPARVFVIVSPMPVDLIIGPTRLSCVAQLCRASKRSGPMSLLLFCCHPSFSRPPVWSNASTRRPTAMPTERRRLTVPIKSQFQLCASMNSFPTPSRSVRT